MPFTIKLYYLELLFELYINDFDNELAILNLNYISDILQEVILRDVSLYPVYIEGLPFLEKSWQNFDR